MLDRLADRPVHASIVRALKAAAGPIGPPKSAYREKRREKERKGRSRARNLKILIVIA